MNRRQGKLDLSVPQGQERTKSHRNIKARCQKQVRGVVVDIVEIEREKVLKEEGGVAK